MADQPSDAELNASMPQTNKLGALSGTVVDTSGAVIAGATLLVRDARGAELRKLQADGNGTFVISALEAGNYVLVVSNPGFETKEIPVTIGTGEQTTPLRIALAVSGVNTKIGRASCRERVSDTV